MPRFRPARWYYEPSRGGLIRTKEGQYDDATMSEPDIEIPFDQIPSLIRALEEANLLKPRLDDRIRSEDLKITHRLLDIIQSPERKS